MNDGNGVIHYKGWYKSYIPHILEEIYIRNVYAPYFNDKKDLTILDLGFNIGLFSMYASKFAKQIYAFEPTLETFEIGKRNIEDNNITNVKLFQKAIMKEDGKITFFHSDNTTMNSAIEAVNSQNVGEKTKEEVDAIRLDTFVKEEGIEHIDFMKMDIEGSEAEVIGSKSFENIAPILDAMVLELHDWNGVNPQQIVTTLRDYGFVVEVIPAQALILGCVKQPKTNK